MVGREVYVHHVVVHESDLRDILNRKTYPLVESTNMQREPLVQATPIYYDRSSIKKGQRES
jgi:hypothetical protein